MSLKIRGAFVFKLLACCFGTCFAQSSTAPAPDFSRIIALGKKAFGLLVFLLVILILLTALSLRAHAQFSKVNSIGFQNNGTPVTNGFFTYPFNINLVGCTAASSSGTLTITCASNSGCVPSGSAGDVLTDSGSGACNSSADFVLTSHTLAGGSSAIFDLHSAAGFYLPGSLSTGCVTVTTSTGAVSSVTCPAGAIVGTTDSQTLTNKSIAGSEINSSVVGATYGGTGVDLSAQGSSSCNSSGLNVLKQNSSHTISSACLGAADVPAALSSSTSIAGTTIPPSSTLIPEITTATNTTWTLNTSGSTGVLGSAVQLLPSTAATGVYRINWRFGEATTGNCTTPGTIKAAYTYVDNDTQLAAPTLGSGAYFANVNSGATIYGISIAANGTISVNTQWSGTTIIDFLTGTALTYQAYQSTGGSGGTCGTGATIVGRVSVEGPM